MIFDAEFKVSILRGTWKIDTRWKQHKTREITQDTIEMAQAEDIYLYEGARYREVAYYRINSKGRINRIWYMLIKIKTV